MDVLKLEVMKTAVAIAQANLDGDAVAMVALWNTTEDADMPQLIGAMAALPTLILKGFGGGPGAAYEPTVYYGHMLDLLNQADDGRAG